jgi:hypothetical protein
MSVSCECCVLSGRGLCVGLITRPEECYRVRRFLTECDREASITRRPWPTGAIAPWGKEIRQDMKTGKESCGRTSSDVQQRETRQPVFTQQCKYAPSKLRIAFIPRYTFEF